MSFDKLFNPVITMRILSQRLAHTGNMHVVGIMAKLAVIANARNRSMATQPRARQSLTTPTQADYRRENNVQSGNQIRICPRHEAMDKLILAQWTDEAYERFMDQTFAALKCELRMGRFREGWTFDEIGQRLAALLERQLTAR